MRKVLCHNKYIVEIRVDRFILKYKSGGINRGLLRNNEHRKRP